MTVHVVTDSSDAAQIAKAEAAQDALADGLKHLLQHAQARAWFYDRLQTLCHLEGSSHVPGCSDSTAFNEGARSVGMALLSEIREAHPAHYLKMIEEALPNG